MGAFGQDFTSLMALSRYSDGQWQTPSIQALNDFKLTPASHVLHYASTCFEGLKAYRWADGGIRLFRYRDNIKRICASAKALCLPIPDVDLLDDMIKDAVMAVANEIPDLPKSLYIRPTLIGTENNIGAAGRASKEAYLYVMTSPVGDYFSGGIRPLKLLVDTLNMRSTPTFGQVKTGGNYAAALSSVMRAREQYGADQVLYCPQGNVQETGAANFFVLKDKTLITKKLDGSILPGITRDSIIQLAQQKGYKINECDFSVDQLMTWLPDSEAFLSGTAAVISPVGQFIHNNEIHAVGHGEIGQQTLAFREQLTAIQQGQQPDDFNWITQID
ncbi:MAG: branched-chain amino acid aminotransferase [Proteobacteria bacterium]|nr:MAG: branched-chain amino acid aminotransferase [Pseudomonadota bacterium]